MSLEKQMISSKVLAFLGTLPEEVKLAVLKHLLNEVGSTLLPTERKAILATLPNVRSRSLFKSLT